MALTFTSFAFDSASYTPGAPVTLTVGYESTDLADASDITTAVTVTLSDAASGTVSQSSDSSGNFPGFVTETAADSAEPVTVAATDSRTPSGAWALVSNTLSGSSAPFTGVAVLTGTA